MIFLLSAAPIGMGCIIAGDDTSSDTEAATSNNPTTSPATDTGGTTDVAESTVGPVSTDDRGETTIEPTTEPPTDTTITPEDTTAGIEIPPACQSYGDAIEACFAGYGEYAAASCANYHMTYSDNYGAECVTAFEDWLACLSGLTCRELMEEEPMACAEQTTAKETACAPA